MGIFVYITGIIILDLIISMKNQAISKVKEVWEKENKILSPVPFKAYKEIIDKAAKLFSAGSYYYYIFNFENLEMEYVHPNVQDILGIKPEAFNVDAILNSMHPEDLAKMHQKEKKVLDFFMHKISREEMLQYKVVYLIRLRNTKGAYKTILHQVKTLTVSEDRKIQRVIGIHTDVTHLNTPVDHKVSLINDKGASYYSMETDSSYSLITDTRDTLFTKREKEIIVKISEGFDFQELAAYFHLSPHTINTHKKNILKKSGCKNTAQLITKCIREGII